MTKHDFFGKFAVIPLALILSSASPTFAQSVKSTPDQMVDALNGVFGKHPGARAVHAKGIVLEGRFLPSPSAATITTAPHLQKDAVKVTVRFSDFAGIPDLPDTEGLARPHGLAVKFHLPDGTDTDIVAHSFNGFPASTTDEFHALLKALGASGPNAPKPTPLDVFLGDHPIAKTFLTTPKPAPVSYASLPYYGVNAFKFTNASGAVTFGRYQLRPVDGPALLSADQTAKAAPGYLADEIGERIHHHPARFVLQLQVAEKGDQIDNPAIAWPETRRCVELGTLEIAKVAADVAAERSLLFLPGAVTAGIEPADPMIEARDPAYSFSYSRRNP